MLRDASITGTSRCLHTKTDNGSDGEDNDIETANEETVEKEVKPLPIILHSNYDYKKLIHIGNTNTKKGITMKFTRNNTVIFTQNKTIYQ